MNKIVHTPNRQSDTGRSFSIILKLMLFFCLFAVQTNAKNSSLKKWYDQKKYAKILRVVNSGSINHIQSFEDCIICGEISFQTGQYQKCDQFYSQAREYGSHLFKTKDILNWGFSLLQINKTDIILSDSIFNRQDNDSKWIQQIRKMAASRNEFLHKRDSLVTIKDLSLDDLIPQYGFNMDQNNLYYSYSRFNLNHLANLDENKIISNQKNELAGIKRVGLYPDTLTNQPGETVKNEIRGFRRLAGLNPLDKKGDFVATVVSQNGHPEQIIIKSDMLPAFPYNSKKYACAMPYFSQLNNSLYFCSNMPGGIGGWDIYFCELVNGKWSRPVNMGDKINTPFDELFPSFSNNCLLFSSEGHEGLGGFDNYLFSFDDQSLKNIWPVNTAGDDLCFRLISDKQLKGLGISSSQVKYFMAESDLFTLLNEEKIQPQQSLIGQDESEEKVLELQDKMGDRSGKEEHAVAEESNGNILLENIYYDLNSYELTNYETFGSAVEQIEKDKPNNIIVWGYTDHSGEEEHNTDLSLQRALGVIEYLKSRSDNDSQRVYYAVAAGEYFSNTEKQINKSDRRAEVYENQQELPYKIIFAYKPQPGEDVKTIAKVFNNDYKKLVNLNKLVPGNRLDQEIVYVGIQGIHVVSSGETVYRIAKNYHTTEEQLLHINKKHDIKLLDGEKLILPIPNKN